MKKILGIIIFLLTGLVYVQAQITITGQVKDENGAGLPGANVLIKGTTLGTVTDVEGKFSLSVPNENSVLNISYIGYLSENITVGSQTNINVNLVPNIMGLEEMVVVGYGTIKKSDMTGAVSSVRTDDLPLVNAITIDNLLQGRAAGLNLTLMSAQPGGAANINIRGAISPNGNNSPLYVIDGVPLTDNDAAETDIYDDDLGFYGGIERSPLSTINPADIESIDILKDASATAIYGSSAANGVILITTKKGEKGKPNVEYRGNYTVQSPKPYYDFLNATEFMQQHNRLAYEKFLFDGRMAPYGVNPIGEFTPLFSQEEINAAGEGTDWLDMLIRDGSIQEHNISMSGGSDKTVVYASFNLHDNKTILEGADFVRYSGRINLDQELSDMFTFRIKLNMSQVNSNNPSTGSNSGGLEKYNMLQAAYAFTPTVDVFDEEGNYTYSFDRQVTNPAAFLIIKDKLRTNRIGIIPNLEIKLFDGLRFNAVGGIDRQTSNRNFYLPVKAQRFNLPDGMAQLSTNRIDNLSSEGYFTYSKELSGSELTIVAGAGYYKTQNDGFFLVGRGFFTDAFEENNVEIATNAESNRLGSYKNERTKLSQFFRVNYSIQNKYMFSVVGRRDGSSIFAENKKWGFFPGISGAWKLSEEDFVKNISVISFLKLRAGYGSSGNESVLVGNSLQLYGSGLQYLIGNTLYNGVTLEQVENKNLTWETDYTLNLGMDIGLWNNRLNASFEFYNKTAKDLLDYNLLPSNNAVGRVADNVGTTQSVGYELTLESKNIVRSVFKWSTDLTASTYKATWVERNPELELPDYIKETDEIRAIYGWETDGIIKQESDRPDYMPNAFLGNAIYVDQDNNDTLDLRDVVKLGNADPLLSIGFGNSFSYKGFDLNIYMYGFLNRKAIYGYVPGGASSTTGNTAYRIAVTNPGNMLTTIKDVWSTDNPDGIYPGTATNAYTGSNPTDNSHLSGNLSGVIDDFYLRDASFIRIKNVSLGYILPKVSFLRNIRSVRIFINIENLAVITKYEGFDPEFSDANPYPQALSTTFGVDVKF